MLIWQGRIKLGSGILQKQYVIGCFDEEEMRMLIQEIPADRIGRPEEAAELVKLLCTGNEYLTGQVITLDGGWT